MTQQKFSKGYIIFTLTFLTCFSILLVYFLVFKFGNILRLPQKGNFLSLFTYGINLLFSIALITGIGLGLWYIFKYNLSKEKAKTSDKSTVRNMFYAIIIFAIIGAKIVFWILVSILSSALKIHRTDPTSILPWLMLAFFGLIAVGMFLIFFIVIKRFRKANKKLQSGEQLTMNRGKVIDKQMIHPVENLNARAGSVYSYSITLDNGEKFINVQREQYNSVEVGQTIEVHTIPLVGEIIHFNVVSN